MPAGEIKYLIYQFMSYITTWGHVIVNQRAGKFNIYIVMS